MNTNTFTTRYTRILRLSLTITARRRQTLPPKRHGHKLQRKLTQEVPKGSFCACGILEKLATGRCGLAKIT